MRKLMLAVAAATTLAAAVPGAANASRSIETGSPGAITVTGRLNTEIARVRASCELTMRLTLARSIAKVAGTGMGSVTSIACGSLRFLGETLPWALRYVSFSGLLPNIAEVRFDIVTFGFLTDVGGPGFGCLFAGPLRVVARGFADLRTMSLVEARPLPMIRSLTIFECLASEARVEGSFRLSPVVSLRLL
jgi:hypothetical protein